MADIRVSARKLWWDKYRETEDDYYNLRDMLRSGNQNPRLEDLYVKYSDLMMEIMEMLEPDD